MRKNGVCERRPWRTARFLEMLDSRRFSELARAAPAAFRESEKPGLGCDVARSDGDEFERIKTSARASCNFDYPVVVILRLF